MQAPLAGPRRPQTMRPWADWFLRRVVPVGLICVGGSSCARGPHFIGDVCPSVDPSAISNGVCPTGAGPAGVTFAIDLDRSGLSFLADDLPLAAGPAKPALRLDGQAALADAWPARVGESLRRDRGVPALGALAPFTDDTRAVGLAADAPTYVAPSGALGAVGGQDFVVEVVLRAAAGAVVIDKRTDGVGWSLRARGDGSLVLLLADGKQPVIEIGSDGLIEGAWYHCLFWAGHGGGGRADCNGRPGPTVELSPLGDLDAPAVAAFGGGALTRVALFALYLVPRGALGDPLAWREVSAQRFASLTGTRPKVASGSVLPKSELRPTAAYLDLQSAPGQPRRLFLVGPDWPRISCRPDAAGGRDCGYLSEPSRIRVVPADPAAWRPSEVAVATQPDASRAAFADGERRLAAVIPSPADGPHSLVITGPFGDARHVLSFFARAGEARLIGATAGGGAMATFDLQTGLVTSAPAGVRATMEPWGDGLFRCAYAFDALSGPTTYALHLLGPAGTPAFAGDGTSAAVYLGGLQVDIGLVYPGSLIAAATQSADQLTFVGDDGNLPAGTAMSVGLRVLLPEGPRVTDQALLNLNRGGGFADQVQLFVTGNTGQLKFWGLRDGVARWTFDHPTPMTDGKRHVIGASWTNAVARVSIDGAVVTQPAAAIANPAAFPLDRIDVGFSTRSSGHLEGLVAGLQIARP